MAIFKIGLSIARLPDPEPSAGGFVIGGSQIPNRILAPAFFNAKIIGSLAVVFG